MCKGAARLADKCTGHGCFPPRVNTQASPDVFTNDRGNHRQGDSWASHCSVCAPAPSPSSSKSPSKASTPSTPTKTTPKAYDAPSESGTTRVSQDEFDFKPGPKFITLADQERAAQNSISQPPTVNGMPVGPSILDALTAPYSSNSSKLPQIQDPMQAAVANILAGTYKNPSLYSSIVPFSPSVASAINPTGYSNLLSRPYGVRMARSIQMMNDMVGDTPVASARLSVMPASASPASMARTMSVMSAASAVSSSSLSGIIPSLSSSPGRGGANGIGGATNNPAPSPVPSSKSSGGGAKSSGGGGGCHTSILAKGSETVFINDKQAGRIGDPVACGSTVATGSENVFIGG